MTTSNYMDAIALKAGGFTMFAIAEAQGINAAGFQYLVINNCEDENLIGRDFAYASHDVEPGKWYLISFEPEDQFCKVIDMKEIRAIHTNTPANSMRR